MSTGHPLRPRFPQYSNRAGRLKAATSIRPGDAPKSAPVASRHSTSALGMAVNLRGPSRARFCERKRLGKGAVSRQDSLTRTRERSAFWVSNRGRRRPVLLVLAASVKSPSADCYLHPIGPAIAGSSPPPAKLFLRYPAGFCDVRPTVLALCMPSGSQPTDLTHFLVLQGQAALGTPPVQSKKSSVIQGYVTRTQLTELGT